MIAVDSSALMAILFEEREGPLCQAVLKAADRLVISAATVTESLIVSGKRGASLGLDIMLQDLDIEIIDVTPEFARLAADVHRRWGKGRHTACPNFGDSFSYALAEMYGCPLLFIGDDFAQTDIVSALA